MKQTLDDENIDALVRYRIQRSDETINEARLMLHEGYLNGTSLSNLYFLRLKNLLLK